MTAMEVFTDRLKAAGLEPLALGHSGFVLNQDAEFFSFRTKESPRILTIGLSGFELLQNKGNLPALFDARIAQVLESALVS